MGKYQRFDLAGKIIEEGIKENDELVKSLPINCYTTRVIKTGHDNVIGSSTRTEQTKDKAGRASVPGIDVGTGAIAAGTVGIGAVGVATLPKADVVAPVLADPVSA